LTFAENTFAPSDPADVDLTVVDLAVSGNPL
jgi:hypothetical protein